MFPSSLSDTGDDFTTEPAVPIANLIRLSADRESGNLVVGLCKPVGWTVIDLLRSAGDARSGDLGVAASDKRPEAWLTEETLLQWHRPIDISLASIAYSLEFAMRWRSLSRTLLSAGIARALDRIGVGSRAAVVADLLCRRRSAG